MTEVGMVAEQVLGRALAIAVHVSDEGEVKEWGLTGQTLQWTYSRGRLLTRIPQNILSKGRGYGRHQHFPIHCLTIDCYTASIRPGHACTPIGL
jgi:hypothetical protein